MMPKQDYFNMVVRSGDLKKVKILNTNSFKLSVLKEALKIAAMHGHLDLVKYFVHLKHNYGTASKEALTASITHGHIDIVKYFVSLGLDPRKHKDSFRLCVIMDHTSMIKYLASLGCDFTKQKLHKPYDLFDKTATMLKFYSIKMIRCLDALGWDYKHEIPKALSNCTDGYCFNSKIHQYILTSITRKDQHATLKANKCKIAITIIQQRLNCRNNLLLQKKSVLKFILRPNSMHMQLSSIE
jgi:hypothetical protein